MSDNKFKAEGIMSKGYGFIAKLVMKDKELTIEAKAIYAYLSSYTGAGNTAYPTVSLMCGDLGISEARFYKHRKLLESKGYIVIDKKRNEGGWSNNVYTLPFKPYPQSLSTQNLCTQNLSTQNVGTKSNSSKSNSIKSNSIKKESVKEKKNPKSKISDDHLKLANKLWNYVKNNFPKHKAPNIDSWANDIRLMMQQDDRTFEEIEDAINWSQANDFWYKNIRSAGKLRKQFDTLVAQADGESKTFGKKENYGKEWDFFSS